MELMMGENEKVMDVAVRPVVKPETTSQERTWAALAHASTLLTLFLAIGSLGLGGVLLVFVPLGIYLAYKDRSEYVAFHAAQAFGLQLACSIGLFAAFLAVILIIVLAWAITGVLSIILIGLILIPVAAVLTVVLVMALVAAPFVLGVFSVVAAIQTANGTDYEYPYLGRWVRNWLARSRVEPAPSV
jgi:hypothetical protein